MLRRPSLVHRNRTADCLKGVLVPLSKSGHPERVFAKPCLGERGVWGVRGRNLKVYRTSGRRRRRLSASTPRTNRRAERMTETPTQSVRDDNYDVVSYSAKG